LRYQQALLRVRKGGAVCWIKPALRVVLGETAKRGKENQKRNKAAEGNGERSKSPGPRVKRFLTHSLISSILPAGSMLVCSERYVKRLVSIVPC